MVILNNMLTISLYSVFFEPISQSFQKIVRFPQCFVLRSFDLFPHASTGISFLLL